MFIITVSGPTRPAGVVIKERQLLPGASLPIVPHEMESAEYVDVLRVSGKVVNLLAGLV